jgi:hypothetical protein
MDITHPTFLPPFPRPGFAFQDFRQLFVVLGVESEEVGLMPFLCPLNQTARMVFP